MCELKFERHYVTLFVPVSRTVIHKAVTHNHHTRSARPRGTNDQGLQEGTSGFGLSHTIHVCALKSIPFNAACLNLQLPKMVHHGRTQRPSTLSMLLQMNTNDNQCHPPTKDSSKALHAPACLLRRHSLHDCQPKHSHC